MRSNRRTFVIVALAFVGGMLLLWAVRHLASTGSIEIVEAEYGAVRASCRRPIASVENYRGRDSSRRIV